jgi:hypothetical protein
MKKKNKKKSKILVSFFEKDETFVQRFVAEKQCDMNCPTLCGEKKQCDRICHAPRYSVFLP